MHRGLTVATVVLHHNANLLVFLEQALATLKNLVCDSLRIIGLLQSLQL